MKLRLISPKSHSTPDSDLITLADRFAFIGLSITFLGRFLAATKGSEYLLPGIINNLTVFAHAAYNSG